MASRTPRTWLRVKLEPGRASVPADALGSVYVWLAVVIRASMQTQTELESLPEKVERLVEESHKPLLSTASTSAAIAELLARIETLELAIREIADAAGAATSSRDTA